MKELIEQILSGDVEAFREIVREYAPEVRLYIARRLPDFHQVEDLTQEIMAAVYWNLKRYDYSSDFGAWVRGITKNKFREYLRREYNRADKLEKLKSEISMQVDRMIDSKQAGEPHKVSLLKMCIEKLPEKMAGLVRARYLENESVQEIAYKLKSSVSAISSHLYRLKKILRDCVESRGQM